MLYLAELPDDERTYYAGSQRPHLDGRVAEFTGVQAERRAEGTAMVEPAQQSRALTDLRFPFKLTDRQAALLLCAPLAQAHYEDEPGLTRAQLLRETRALVERYGSHWGRSPDSAEVELLLDNALRVLVALKLVGVDGELVRPLPALARFQSAAVRAGLLNLFEYGEQVDWCGDGPTAGHGGNRHRSIPNMARSAARRLGCAGLHLGWRSIQPS